MEQPKHQTVLIHDAGHIIQRIDAKKKSGESECALLNRGELFGHGGSCWYYSAALPGLQVISSVRADRLRVEVPLKRARRLLLPVVLVVASVLVVGAKKIFDYAAGPNKEKESDFVFPHNLDQEKPTVLLAEPKSPPFNFEQRGGFVNDASHLNKTSVYGVVHITSEDDIRNALQFARDHNLKVTCAGQQHSMGGQTFTHDGLVLDLRNFNHIRLDKEHKSVNLQSGVRWWQLQQLLDTEGLSVKSMQSINIFSVGGTLSINAHGIDPMPGPIAPTVRSLRVMLSDGSTVQASPTENTELFRHVLGGYGLFGVILDVDLDIVDNEMYEWKTQYMSYNDFAEYYQKQVEGNPKIALTYGRLSMSPSSYLTETALHTYAKTQFHGVIPPLRPAGHVWLDRLVINLSKTGGF